MSTPFTILVVDEVNSIRKTVTNTLKREISSANILESPNTKHALRLLGEASKVDYVLSDLEMSDGSGLSFIEAARKTQSANAAAYVVMSSRSDREALLKAASVGVSDYIVKPFSANTLSVKFRKLAGAKSRATERVSLLEAFKATVKFGAHLYQGSLLDASLGGCQLRTELLNRGGGCIYDKCVINIEHEIMEGVPIEAMLVRAERDLESRSSDSMLAAFQFTNSDKNIVDKLSQLLKVSKHPTIN